MRRKVLSVVLCVCMMMTMAPFAFAEEDSAFDLADKITKATSGATITLPAGEYTIPTNVTYTDKALTIKAAKGANVSFDMSSAKAIHSANITFEDVTFDYKTNNDYIGLQHATKLTYNNCKINGKVFLYAQQESFTGCTFTQTAEDYNIWCYGSGDDFTETFKNCTFNGKGKFLNVYRENSNPIRVNLTDCKFINSADTAVKSAVNVKETCGATVLNNTVYINNCTVDGQFPTNKNGGSTLYMVDDLATSNPNTTVYVNNEKVWENGATVEKLDETNSAAKITTSDGTTYYKTLAAAVEAAKPNEATTITLLGNVTLSNYIYIKDRKDITLDLNGYTVTHNGNYVFLVGNAKFHVTGTGTIFENKKDGYAPITAKGSPTDTENYTIVTVDKDVTLKGDYAGIFVSTDTAEKNSDGTYSCHNYGLVINMSGSIDLTTIADGVSAYGVYVNGLNKVETGNVMQINLNGVRITTDEEAIYAAGYAKWNLKNCTFNAENAAIEIRAGEMTIDGGTYIATAPEFKYVANGNGSTTEGAALAIMQHTTKLPITVNVKNGTFIASAAIAEKNVQENNPNPNITLTVENGMFGGTVECDDVSNFITGGYFTTDPSAYCVDGKTGISSGLADYPWTVGTKSATKAEVASGAPTVDTDLSYRDGSAEKELLEATKTALSSAEVDGNGIATAAADIANKNTVTADTNVVESLNNAINSSSDVTAEDTNIVIQTYMDMQITGVSTENDKKSITVDIQPMYRTVATTADVKAGQEIVLPNSSSTLPVNAVQIGTPKPLSITGETTVTIQLPENFVSPTDGSTTYPLIYVQHKGHEYIATVTATTTEGATTLIATFTNPDGFSPFTISTESTAVAKIGENRYTSFQAAVDAANDGETITLVKSDDVSATMSGASRTITVKASTDTVNVTVNGETKAADADTGATFTYTRPSHSSSGSTTTSYNVNVTAATNGTVAADKKTAEKGATVTVTATPAKGYVVEAVKVTDKDGKDVAVTAKDGKYVFTMPGSAVTVTGSFKAETPAESGLPFVDVKNGDWFYDAVKYAYENGLMTGTSATTFAPNGTMNRAMIVTVLYRLEKSPAVTAAAKFTDVPAGQWYSDAVAWAAANGIVNGYDETTFGPMNAVTREQLAAILFRYEQSKGLENVTLEENLNRFPDKDKISAYAVPALQWAVGQKVINGNADGTLDPTGTATRAQVAQILMNLLQ